MSNKTTKGSNVSIKQQNDELVNRLKNLQLMYDERVDGSLELNDALEEAGKKYTRLANTHSKAKTSLKSLRNYNKELSANNNALESDLAALKSLRASDAKASATLTHLSDKKVDIAHKEIIKLRDREVHLQGRLASSEHIIEDLFKDIKSMTFGDRLAFLFTNRVKF